MSDSSPSIFPSEASRRQLLRAGGAAALAASAGLVATRVSAQPRKITFAWNATAFCLSPVVVAQELGYFEKNGLQVDLVNYTGSTDQLLESLATGKADAAVGMIHRWLKPLESGFDVKIIGSSHGGCVRLVGVKDAGVTSLQSLKGKVIGVSDIASPGKNFFSILLKKNGIDAERDVTWRQYPADLLDIAVDKGEIQAIADGDPNIYLIEKRKPARYQQIASNLSGEYKDKVCCIVGARGEFVRNDRKSAAALVRSILQASDYVADNPNESARLFARYSPKVSVEDLRALLGTLTHGHHPTGTKLLDEVEFYARDFQGVGVLKSGTNPARFARHVTADVLA
ncbi:ABC transporter substrate-binding protein [Paracidovorax cattleyae]|uniref:NitT/TauT family transport system substrate-binding protein n=1 Tax=Paracidovorax cattleyae TaxID=80868 RepID=A0A1H0WP58_9BURK|nr:ABC transporter substrate-binding protein [Paracidovorax cattleyae]MBF9267168.1 ABC transporter substrate-binding protein [Paracidovorax cattleyae]SDP92391.1 NitT/TauT family transport system substrate-binding protein [Paracidovorax cattleyae]